MTYVALLRIIHYHKLIGKKELVNALIVNFVSVFGVLAIDIFNNWNYMFLMKLQLPDMPIINTLQIPAILNSHSWISAVVMIVLYAFGTYASWIFASWMSRKALRMEFLDAVEDATEI